MRVHLAAEHALELELAHLSCDLRQIALHLTGRGLVVLALGEFKEFERVTHRACGGVDAVEFCAETRALFAELLGPLRLLPDGRVFKFPAYFFETFFIEVVFKETPLRS
jgi:hypothetical protein